MIGNKPAKDDAVGSTALNVWPCCVKSRQLEGIPRGSLSSLCLEAI